MTLFIKPTEFGCVIEVKQTASFNKGVIKHQSSIRSYSFAVPKIIPIRKGDEVVDNTSYLLKIHRKKQATIAPAVPGAMGENPDPKAVAKIICKYFILVLNEKGCYQK